LLADDTAQVAVEAPPDKKLPKVSVCVITYNHEKYISQCLQSIVDQVTDFDFEVIVGDDFSTDDTRKIVRYFAEKYPDNFSILLHPRNIGGSLNYIRTHELATGEYVAHCDGDDIWLPGKLAYQARLLDRNPYASQCWCCAHLIDDCDNKVGIFPSRLARLLYPTTITAKDIALSYALVGQHSTQMYRRKYMKPLDCNKPTLDFWSAFNIALHGPAIYSKKILGCYRITTAPSVTRTISRRRIAVDVLAIHLQDIIKNHPEFSSAAKSNMVARRFFSKMKGHEVDQISKLVEDNKNVPLSYLYLVKTSFFFLLQKLF
jgi:glycosyltransferase involved in cell wall biosynthesis